LVVSHSCTDPGNNYGNKFIVIDKIIFYQLINFMPQNLEIEFTNINVARTSFFIRNI